MSINRIIKNVFFAILHPIIAHECISFSRSITKWLYRSVGYAGTMSETKRMHEEYFKWANLLGEDLEDEAYIKMFYNLETFKTWYLTIWAA